MPRGCGRLFSTVRKRLVCSKSERGQDRERSRNEKGGGGLCRGGALGSNHFWDWAAPFPPWSLYGVSFTTKIIFFPENDSPNFLYDDALEKPSNNPTGAWWHNLGGTPNPPSEGSGVSCVIKVTSLCREESWRLQWIWKCTSITIFITIIRIIQTSIFFSWV